MLSAILLIAFIIAGVALVLILTDLVKVTPAHRATASKVATALFLVLVFWFFVVLVS